MFWKLQLVAGVVFRGPGGLGLSHMVDSGASSCTDATCAQTCRKLLVC